MSIDGPSGIGKTTTIRLLGKLFADQGRHVHLTSEPSTGPIGITARELTETISGHALALLYTADRHHHWTTEIQPSITSGTTVITDRYVPSALVMQRFDDIPLPDLWDLNKNMTRPDLTVILTADPATITQRLAHRGTRNRFQRVPDSAHREHQFFAETAELLISEGFHPLIIDTTDRPAHHVADEIFQAMNSGSSM